MKIPEPRKSINFLVLSNLNQNLQKFYFEDFSSNVFTSGEVFFGSMSRAYKSKKDILLDFSKNEENTNVKTWISEYISTFLEKDKMD